LKFQGAQSLIQIGKDNDEFYLDESKEL
jgi:hypothetical protein